MIEEMHVLGMYMPAPLLWAILAGLATALLGRLIRRLPIYHVDWHPGLFDLTLFLLLWWGLVALSDHLSLPEIQ